MIIKTNEGNEILMPLFKPCTDKDIKGLLKKRQREPEYKNETFNRGTDFSESKFAKLSGYYKMVGPIDQ